MNTMVMVEKETLLQQLLFLVVFEGNGVSLFFYKFLVIPLGVCDFFRYEEFLRPFFDMFFQTLKIFGCLSAMVDKLLSYIVS